MSFSYEDFRGTAELRAVVREFLTSDVGMIMIRVLRARYKPSDVPSNSDAIASARVLSQYHGAHICLDDLEALAVPPKLDLNLEPNFRADETDHERMPADTRPEIVAHFLTPKEQPSNDA
jgi:hypothetical protein